MPTLSKINQDPELLKTKQAMCAAIFQLLENESFVKITIIDICKVAKVSRTTFYQHFRDKYELIQFALEHVNTELLRSSDGSAEKIIDTLLDFVYKNRKILRNLNEQNEELLHMLYDISVSSLKDYLENTTEIPKGFPIELSAVFLAGGRAWLLLWWINSGCQIPKEQMRDYLLSILKP